MRRPIVVVCLLTVLAAVGACSSEQPDAAASPTVTRAQVGWMDTVCGELTALDRYRAAETDASSGLGGAGGDRDFSASSYVRGAVRELDRSVQSLSSLPPLAVAAADTLVADRLRELNRIKPEIDRIGETEDTGFDRTAAQSRQAATRTSQLIMSIAVPDPGLPSVASGDPSLALAYDVAPGCDPIARQNVAAPPGPAAPGPPMLPVPADGTNLAACADGTCQVRLDRPTAVTVAGTLYEVDTDTRPLTVTTRFGSGGVGRTSLDVGDSGAFGSGGRTTTVAVDGAAGGVAIVRFATRG